MLKKFIFTFDFALTERCTFEKQTEYFVNLTLIVNISSLKNLPAHRKDRFNIIFQPFVAHTYDGKIYKPLIFFTILSQPTSPIVLATI